MNLKKIAAGAVASVVAIGAMAISASADNLYYPSEETAPELEINGGNWLYTIYNSGDGLGDENAVTSHDFDPWDIAEITLYGEIVVLPESELELTEYAEDMDGVFSGIIIYSANSGYYGTGTFNSPQYDDEDTYFSKFNWPPYEYYGLPHEGDTYEGRSEDTGGDGTNTGWCDWTKTFVPVYLAPYTYSFTMEIPDDMRWPTPADESEMAGLYRVGYGAWGDSMLDFGMKFDLMVLKDDDGNVLLAVDDLGYEITEEEAETLIEELSSRTVADDGEGSDDGSNDSSSDDGSNDSSSGDGSTTTSSNGGSNSSSSSSSSCGGSNASIVSGLLVIAAIVIGFIKKSA